MDLFIYESLCCFIRDHIENSVDRLQPSVAAIKYTIPHHWPQWWGIEVKMGLLCSALFYSELRVSIWIHAPHPWYHSQSMTPSKAWQNTDRPLSITLCCGEMSSGSVCSRRRGFMGSDETQQPACPQKQMARNTPHFLVFFSIIEISYT